jgi:hypothetical protein
MPCHAHATPMPHCSVALRSRFHNGMVVAWHGHGMACESNTAALCKSNGKDTIYTLSGMDWQGNGMGAAWEWQGMCELALIESVILHKYPNPDSFTEQTLTSRLLFTSVGIATRTLHDFLEKTKPLERRDAV